MCFQEGLRFPASDCSACSSTADYSRAMLRTTTSGTGRGCNKPDCGISRYRSRVLVNPRRRLQQQRQIGQFITARRQLSAHSCASFLSYGTLTILFLSFLFASSFSVSCDELSTFVAIRVQKSMFISSRPSHRYC